MKHTIKLSEKQCRNLQNMDLEQERINDILAESFCPSAEKVRLVKKYLDKNFKRDKISDIDDYASPVFVPVITRIVMGEPVEQLKEDDAIDLLVDKFPNMVSDKNDLKKFMKQILSDWYNKRITDTGILSVNYIL